MRSYTFKVSDLNDGNPDEFDQFNYVFFFQALIFFFKNRNKPQRA